MQSKLPSAGTGILLAALLLLSACTPQPTCPPTQVMINNICCFDENANGVCDSEEEEEVAEEQEPAIELEIGESEEEPVVITPEAEEVPAVVTPPLSSRQSTQQLIDKFNQKAKSYAYTYYDNEYAIRGDAVRVKLSKFTKTDAGIPFNTIYLNRTSKEARGYCEGERSLAGRVCEEDKGPFIVDFQTYNPKTPVDWLQEYRTETPLDVQPGQKTLQSRQTDLWIFQKNNVDVDFWIDSTYGIPIQVILEQGGRRTTHLFSNLYVNAITEETFAGKI